MATNAARRLAQKAGGAFSRVSNSRAQSKQNLVGTPKKRRIGKKTRQAKSILNEIGIVGCESIEPLIIAALVTEDPLLLIGPHGTGKSFLLNQISKTLGIEWRHYNASILNFDDLIGFPVPDQDGSLKYIKTENSIWGAHSVFFDEISRCRPDIQNKMFPIVHERRVQGIELKDLRYRWAAMNPPMTDDTEDDYLGSEPLDLAFADRFAFVIEMPSWGGFSDDQKMSVIQMDSNSIQQSSDTLATIIEATRELIGGYQESHGDRIGEYVLRTSNLLQEAGITLSPRRTNMLFRSIIAVYATSLPLNLDIELNDLTYLVLKNSIPTRCTGVQVKDLTLYTAHSTAWKLINLDKNDTLRVIMTTNNLIVRLKLALSASDLKKTQLTTIVSDVFSSTTLGSRAAIAKYIVESGLLGGLNAATAEELGALYHVMIIPPNFNHSVSDGSSEHELWSDIESFISKLNTNSDVLDSYIANYIAHLYIKNELFHKNQLEVIYDDWMSTNKTLGEPA